MICRRGREREGERKKERKREREVNPLSVTCTVYAHII
jgi:hypothetical protein